MDNKTRSFIVKSAKYIANIFIICIILLSVGFVRLFFWSMSQGAVPGIGPNYAPLFAIFCLFLCALFTIIPIRLYMMNRVIKEYELQNQPEKMVKMLKNLKATSIVLVVVFILPFMIICYTFFMFAYIFFTGANMNDF